MTKQPQGRPSTAPIALLLTAGVLCLGLSASFPTRYEISTANPYVAGEPTSFVVTSGIDPASTAVFVGLLAVAVIAFAAAGRLIYRRRR